MDHARRIQARPHPQGPPRIPGAEDRGARSAYVPDILRRLAGTEFATQEGTLYPLLSKLRREELVLYEWQESDAGPPRKYYRLTDAGKAQLAALDDYWNLINRTIADIGH